MPPKPHKPHRPGLLQHSTADTEPASQLKKTKKKKFMPKHVIAMNYLYDPELHGKNAPTFRCEYCKAHYLLEFAYKHLVGADVNTSDTGRMACRYCGPLQSSKWIARSIQADNERKAKHKASKQGVQAEKEQGPDNTVLPTAVTPLKGMKFGKPPDYTPPDKHTHKT